MAKKATLDDRTVTKDELKQVARANESWKTPVVFVHGLWLLPSSWDRWAKMFEAAGYCAVRPGWPDDPDTVEEASGTPRGVRPQVGRRHRRSLRSRDPQARSQARRDRTQLRRAAHADPRRPGMFRGLGGHRSRSVPRRAPPPDLRIALCVTRAEEPREPPPGGAADVRAVPLRLRQRAQRGGSASRCTRSSRFRVRASRSSRPRQQTSTPGPRRRSTARTPTGDPC